MTPRFSPALSRRDALKTLGAGAALVGLGALSLRSLAADNPAPRPRPVAGAPETMQPFTLPALGYAYDALEPHVDARTMEIHHTKHHQAYINAANAALAEHPELRQATAEQLLRDLAAVPEKIRLAIRNQVGGHVNHSFFWKVIAPGGAREPGAALGAAIAAKFGTLDAFKKEFADAAMKRFGSGWAWLSVKDGVLRVHSTANQDSPLSEGAVPVLGLDVWEHAYYLRHQNLRANYVTAFWEVVSWAQADANYGTATMVG